MFYYLSKIIWFFATPSNLLPSVALLGLLLALFTRFRRVPLYIATFSIITLFLCGLAPVANWVMLPLEQRFPPHMEKEVSVDGIIVLGGSVMGDETMLRGQLAINDAGERIIALGDLARQYPKARIIFTGGGGTLMFGGTAEADAVKIYAETLGVLPERIEFESQSRTTRENAILTREMVNPQKSERWLLVTSAWHMPRAVGSFRKAGFDVIAYPVDFRTRGPQDVTRTFAFVSEGLRRLDLASKEWAGLIGYRLAGYTSEILPSP